jgi:hypothetical protein
VRQLSTIDETGTLDLSGLNIYNENDALQQEMKEMNDIPVPKEVLQVHGFSPPKKADGTVRLIYENVDGINTRLCDNQKVERMVWCRPGWPTTVTYLTPAPAPPLVLLYQQLHTTIS